MMEEQDELGQKLRRCRTYLGFTQDQVARYLGITRPAVSEFEAGRRKIDALELMKLCKLYRRPAGYFLGTDQVSLSREFTELISGLEVEDRKELIEFAEFLAWRRRFPTGEPKACRETKDHGATTAE